MQLKLSKVDLIEVMLCNMHADEHLAQSIVHLTMKMLYRSNVK